MGNKSSYEYWLNEILSAEDIEDRASLVKEMEEHLTKDSCILVKGILDDYGCEYRPLRWE